MIIQYRPIRGLNISDEEFFLGDDMLMDENGKEMQNPYVDAQYTTRNKEYRTFQANGGLTYKLMKNLTFRNNTGMRYQTRRDELFYGERSLRAIRSSINGALRTEKPEVSKHPMS